MANPRGNPNLPKGTGRKKGSKNVVTVLRRDIAEQFLECVHKVGGVEAVFMDAWNDRKKKHMIADTLFKQFIPKKIDVEVVKPIEVVIIDNVDTNAGKNSD